MTEKSELHTWLSTVLDPDLGMPLTELGLIYEAKVLEEKKAEVIMTLTSPACPAGDYLMGEIKKRALEHPEVQEVDVKLVWEPKWDPKLMASEEAKETLGIW